MNAHALDAGRRQRPHAERVVVQAIDHQVRGRQREADWPTARRGARQHAPFATPDHAQRILRTIENVQVGIVGDYGARREHIRQRCAPGELERALCDRVDEQRRLGADQRHLLRAQRSARAQRPRARSAGELA
ncbi:MAG: hypothetical protein QM756_29120 [Polyangiaceae bacterium]